STAAPYPSSTFRERCAAWSPPSSHSSERRRDGADRRSGAARGPRARASGRGSGGGGAGGGARRRGARTDAARSSERRGAGRARALAASVGALTKQAGAPGEDRVRQALAPLLEALGPRTGSGS